MTTTPSPSINVIVPTGTAVGPWTTGWTYSTADDVWIYIETDGEPGPDLIDGVDYTLTGATPEVNGGSVTLAGPTVPEGGWTASHRIILRRWTVRRQGVALPDTEGHKPRATEKALDRAMRIAEEVSDDLDLTVKVAPGQTPPSAADLAALAGGIGGVIDDAAAAGGAAGASAAAAAVEGKADDDLANATLTQAAPNAVSRTVVGKFRETLSIEDFEAVSEDDQAVVEYALEAAADADGSLKLTGFKARVIEENLAVLAKVQWVGPLASPDTPLQNYDFDDTIGKLVVLPTASLIMGNEASLENWRIIRSGLDVPFANLAAARAGIAAFAGTAIKNGSTGCNLRNLQILGFALAFESTVGQRVNVDKLRIDCTSGIAIYEAADVTWVSDTACIPMLTANQGFEGGNAASYDVLSREGTAFLFDGVTNGAINDWFNATNCFSFGYLYGYRCEGGDHGTFLNCAADNAPQLALAGGAYLTRAQNTIGFKIGQGSRNIVLETPRAAAQGRAFVVETNGDGARVAINAPRSWLPIVRHVHHVSGTMVLHDTGGFEPRTSAEVAASYPDGNVILLEDTITEADITLRGASAPAISGSATALAKTTFNGQKRVVVASASSIAVAPYWTVIALTGATNVGTISATFPGHVIELSSAAALQIISGGNIRLENNVRFVFEAPGDRLFLTCDGTFWNECSDSRNSATVVSSSVTASPQAGALTTASTSVVTRLERDLCTISVTFDCSAVGTATGYLTITTPFVSAERVALAAVESGTSGAGLSALIVVGGSDIVVYRNGAGNVAASGQVITVSGQFRVAT